MICKSLSSQGTSIKLEKPELSASYLTPPNLPSIKILCKQRWDFCRSVPLTRGHTDTQRAVATRTPNFADLCFLIPTCFISFQSNHAHAPIFLSSSLVLESIGDVAQWWSSYLACVSLGEALGSIPSTRGKKKKSQEFEFWLHSLPELDLASLKHERLRYNSA